jgi:CDP-4-dehydro-6-deoxyglucose reductase, E3
MPGVLEVRAVAPLVAGVVEVDLVAIEPPTIAAVPGQYVSLILPGGERRSYSIASPPARRDGVTLLVRQRGRGASVAGLSPGTRLPYDGPRGDFRLAPRHPGDLVFVATGVGAAAVFPMMEEAVGRDEPGRILLFWGLERPEEAFWQDRLAALAASARVDARLVFASEGFVTAPVVAAAAGLAAPTFYLCGHTQMVRDVIDSLVAAGVDRARQIRTDAY